MSALSQSEKDQLSAVYILVSWAGFSVADIHSMNLHPEALFFLRDIVIEQHTMTVEEITAEVQSGAAKDVLDLTREELIELAEKAVANPHLVTLREIRMLAQYVLTVED